MIAEPTVYINKLTELIESIGYKVLTKQVNLKQIIESQREANTAQLIMLDVKYIKENKQIVSELKAKLSLPIIVLSSRSVNDTAHTVYAITNGASDFIVCERLEDDAYVQDVFKKITNVLTPNRINKSVIKRSKQRKHLSATPAKQRTTRKKVPKYPFDFIVAIGTSTGGPKALQTVLKQLPENFPAPIVIVQHMPSGFTKSLAKRLNEICDIRVKEASDGEVLQAGTAYIAPGDYHMAITEDCHIEIYQEDVRDGHRPSVNILFKSIAVLEQIKKIAIILTGMGKDGALGIEKMKERDKETIVIVESKETAIIHGMPRAALQTGYVTEVSRLEHIGKVILHYVMERGI